MSLSSDILRRPMEPAHRVRSTPIESAPPVRRVVVGVSGSLANLAALHAAAAAYRPAMVRLLVAGGAQVDARNRRGAQPLHYAADGTPGSRTWNPRAQAETVTCLIDAGADPNATDKSGVRPLHRAVRTRCAAAVSALLDGGADPRGTNNRGSTPRQLATRTTGRGGSGSPEAKAQQEEILKQFQRRGVTT